MIMNGVILKSIDDLKKNFSIDELIDCYYSGELGYFLKETGNYKKAYKVCEIPKNNALLLIRLYQIFEIEPEMSEEEIRAFAV